MVENNIKYQAISTKEFEDIDTTKRKQVNSVCIWSSIRTIVLLTIYFIPSISLTFYQRWLIQKFHFPLTIVVCHLVIKFVCAAIIRKLLEWKQGTARINLGWKIYCQSVSAVGIASGIDVGLSNWGLEFVTISLYTLTKSTTIIFIFMCAIIFKLEKKSWSLGFIVVMISLGLTMFTYKATQFDGFGFILLLFASFSSGLRWTCAQLLLQNGRLGIQNPIDMVYHVQPWMIVSVLPFAIAIEGPAFVSSCMVFRFTEWNMITSTIIKVCAGAFLAFIMEVSEFLVVTYTSSLTLSVGGIFKEVFILFLAVEWNGDEMSTINAIGLLVCLSGIISHVVHKIRNTTVTKTDTYYEETEGLELGTPLISESPDFRRISSDDDEQSDTEVLFNILNSRER